MIAIAIHLRVSSINILLQQLAPSGAIALWIMSILLYCIITKRLWTASYYTDSNSPLHEYNSHATVTVFGLYGRY